MKRILITGVNGFVGSYLSRALAAYGYEVLGSVREAQTMSTHCAVVAVGAINAATDWSRALSGIDCVVHLAGSTQTPRGAAAQALAALRPVNVDGAANLARQAAACGVKRFIYLSSIKVNGEQTFTHPFQADDPAHPEDPYAQSKWEAEQALREIGAATGMDVVVIRPPLIYGPGAKGNILRLLRLVDKRWPLPLGSVRNARSLVGIGNLCDLIRVCVEHPNAPGEIFLAADGDDLSTPQLLRFMAEALRKPLRLLPVPVMVLHGLGKLFAMSAPVARLTGDLRVDIGKSRRRLGWTPPFPVVEGVREMAEAYKNPLLINL